MFQITSTYSMTASLRRALALLQSDLAQGQKEVSSLRHADLGVTLGSRANVSFSTAALRDNLEATIASNNIVGAKLDKTGSALSQTLSDAQQMRAALVAAQAAPPDRGAIITQARQAFTTFLAKLNSADSDGFIFGGIATDRPPITDYFAPSAANKSALDSAFSTEFGVTQSDPAVSGITGAAMANFLSGPFQSLFSDANWGANWSSASDAVTRSQVSLSVTMNSSISANEPPLRKIASAYLMVTELSANDLNSDAFGILVKSAMDTLSAGINGLLKIQAQVGVMQSTLQQASDMMSLQKDSLDTQLEKLEGVDPAEASTRVKDLLTRIETAYALTARISELSLTKYL